MSEKIIDLRIPVPKPPQRSGKFGRSFWTLLWTVSVIFYAYTSWYFSIPSSPNFHDAIAIEAEIIDHLYRKISVPLPTININLKNGSYFFVKPTPKKPKQQNGDPNLI